MVRSKFQAGNQSALIRNAFMGEALERRAMLSGLHPARVKGMGNWLSNPPSFGTSPSMSPSGVPTFTTTATSTPSGGGSDWASNLINAVGGFVTSRWGQQRGTITYAPDGSIIQKQAAGVPIATQAPYIVGGAIPGPISNQGAAGFALGTGSMLLIGGGLLAVLLLTKK